MAEAGDPGLKGIEEIPDAFNVSPENRSPIYVIPEGRFQKLETALT
jgi:hypothetical protein